MVSNRSEIRADERRSQCRLPSFVGVVNADAVVFQASLEGRGGVVVNGDDIRIAAQVVVFVALPEDAEARCVLPVSSCRTLPDAEVVVDAPAIVLHSGGKIFDLGRGPLDRKSSCRERVLVAV